MFHVSLKMGTEVSEPLSRLFSRTMSDQDYPSDEDRAPPPPPPMQQTSEQASINTGMDLLASLIKAKAAPMSDGSESDHSYGEETVDDDEDAVDEDEENGTHVDEEDEGSQAVPSDDDLDEEDELEQLLVQQEQSQQESESRKPKKVEIQ
jgi:hypothetical protein